jgi:hypothetical protein
LAHGKRKLASKLGELILECLVVPHSVRIFIGPWLWIAVAKQPQELQIALHYQSRLGAPNVVARKEPVQYSLIWQLFKRAALSKPVDTGDDPSALQRRTKLSIDLVQSILVRIPIAEGTT